MKKTTTSKKRRVRRRRFWTHGEQDLGRFWCYGCGRFVHRRHLDIPHIKSAADMYLDSAAEYERLVASGDAVYRSPPSDLQIKWAVVARLLQ